MFDFTLFYLALAICGGIGVLAAVFSKRIAETMTEVDSQSNGRVANH